MSAYLDMFPAGHPPQPGHATNAFAPEGFTNLQTVATIKSILKAGLIRNQPVRGCLEELS